jgi:hypothetical protein
MYIKYTRRFEMRKLFISLFVFLLLTVPVRADEIDTLDVNITLETILVFTINNAGALTFTYDEYVDFGVANDIGDVDYDLTCNQGWQVTGIILDGTQGGQVADDWDAANWTLTVNTVTIDETAGVVIDSDGSAVYRDDSVWDVTLNIPWPESAATPDCTIQLTAAAV